MANNKKLVEAITSMEEDFAQWYTDVVKKADLIDYTSVKGCMVIKPAGYHMVMRSGKISRMNWTEDLKRQGWRMYICQCLFRKVFFKRKKTM